MRFPPVPITPPYFRSLPEQDRPVWFYRIDHDTHATFREEFARRQKQALGARAAEIDDEITCLQALPEIGPVERRKIAQLESQRKALGDVELGEVWDEGRMLDHVAEMLGHVLVYAETVDEDGARSKVSYPSDHAARVKQLRAIPPQALAELVAYIHAQQVNPEHAGKS